MLENKFEQFYQGDILYLKISENELPKDLKWENVNKEFVVAEGEISGHKHLITIERGTAEIAKDPLSNLWLKVYDSVILTHPDHNPEVQTAPRLNPGVYFVGRQWEYNPQQERLVKD